ncbi:MAG: tRNA lysidine(34) synthetase TilS, partial [Alphaproteobacteria bacterium]|nr:tRNA lysidine(34) synthetase TilS [Alphaproteobacteria bacterium]
MSGGADSTALLLHAAATHTPSALVALAIDHGTRVATAAERARIAGLAQRLGIAFRTLTVQPKGHGHAHWRAARLEALVGFCRDHGLARLWLGQHGDDAIETAAIRLLAGGPLEGLAGISAARSVDGVRIERPLLDRSARDLRRGLMAAGVGWAEDPSNRNPAYKRSAVRRVLNAPLPDRVGTQAQARDAERVRRIARWRMARERLEAEAWA